MALRPISNAEFAQFQRFIYDSAGITMSDAKRALVSGRLAKRVAAHQLERYGDYFALLKSGQRPEEVQMAVDLLTTNETYFFRESKHFDLLRSQAQLASQQSKSLRFWSAASSSGEEAYTAAMVLAEAMPTTPWDILGTDISARVLESARRGLYPLERGRHIPPAYLQRYCRKGSGRYDGYFLIDRALRSRVIFRQVNLNAPLPELGLFDVVFLRNVLIYFNLETKRAVVSRVLANVKLGGYFCIGHSESLNDINQSVKMVAPATYRKIE